MNSKYLFVSTTKDVIFSFALCRRLTCSSNPGPAMTRLQLDTQSEGFNQALSAVILCKLAR